MSTLFTESLDKKYREVYSKLADFSKDFVLAGGTAIMLQINHRKSFDFDCFSEIPLKTDLARKAKQIFGKDIKLEVNNSDLLLFRTSKGIKVDFVYYPYKPLHKPEKSKPISLFNIHDLASNKAYTVGRRATWRDYVDIFFLLKWGISDINKMIKDAKERFAGEFSEKLFLEQLVYYDDLEIDDIDFLKEGYSTQDIQYFLQEEVIKYTKLRI